MNLWGAAAVFGLLSLGTATASAAPARLAIFAKVNVPENRQTIDTVALLERLADDASYAVDVTVVRPSELLTTDAGKNILECGADLKCLGAGLRAASIDLGLVTRVDLSSETALVLVLLIDGSNAAVRGRIIDEAPSASPAEIEEAVLRAAARLLEQAGHTIGGRLRLSVTPLDAALRLQRDGEEPASVLAGASLTLRAGNYLASAEREGYLPKTAPVAIAARSAAEVSLALDEDSVWYGSAWFWVPVAAVVVAGAVTGIVLASSGVEDPPLRGDDARVILTLRLP
jgi:hypothetical protein